jgi:hypothetical protein
LFPVIFLLTIIVDRCLFYCPFSFGHCVVCLSLYYGLWLPLWYLLAIVLSVLLCIMASDYPFGIFWPLCCLFFFVLWPLVTPLVSFGHCIVCSSFYYGLWLPLWYLLAIVLSVLLCIMASDYPFGIFWPLCCLFFFGFTASDYPFGIFKLFFPILALLLGCHGCVVQFFILVLLILSCWIYGDERKPAWMSTTHKDKDHYFILIIIFKNSVKCLSNNMWN